MSLEELMVLLFGNIKRLRFEAADVFFDGLVNTNQHPSMSSSPRFTI